MLDAEESLRRFLCGDPATALPDAAAFASFVGGVLDRVGANPAHRGLRLYGEMVDLLARGGNFKAAMRLEELWERLADERAFQLHCAYGLRSFNRAENGAVFDELCGLHSSVEPAEGIAGGPGPAGTPSAEELQLALAKLQQRAHALEHEIAGRKALEAQRDSLVASERAARQQAEHANAAKDQFLAVLSHELRAPLHAIVGWTQVLRRSPLPDALAARALDTIERNVEAQTRVVNDLLDVSRIVSGKLEIRRAPLNLAAVLAEAVESLRPVAAARSVAVVLMAPEQGCRIAGDRGRILQMLNNLLNNAVKFTPAGGNVAVRLLRAAATARIEIEDDGDGIDPALLPNIFDRFVQSEASTTRRRGGLGLGLAIVRELAALHGGHVEAASDGLGRGARFILSLPLTPAAGIAPISSADPLLQLAGKAGAGALDVLVVEDDVDSREALGLILQLAGARVRLAPSVDGALAAYDAAPPEVVLSDIAMAGKDGYALIREIRERERGSGRRALAIALTGFAAGHDRDRALAAGFDDHVAKPIDPSVLLRRIAREDP